jgi:Spy/CpxP family protein refolding chaperone
LIAYGTNKCRHKENAMETTHTNRSRHWGKHGLFALLAVPVLLAAGFCAARAWADDGFAFGRGGFGHGGFGAGTGEQHKAFMEKRLDRVLDQVKATDSQRTAVKSIFERMFAEMRPIHEQHKTLHDQIVTALSADTVDRAAVEALRKQVPTLVDQASQVLTKAVLDISQVLSAEQRQTVMRFIQDHHRRPHRFM